MKKVAVLTFLSLIYLQVSLQAQRLKFVNGYEGQIQLEIIRNDRSSEKRVLNAASPVRVDVGLLASIARINIQPYGQVRQYLQVGSQQVNLDEARVLLRAKPDENIIITIGAGLGGWGSWTFKASLEESIERRFAGKTLEDIFPRVYSAYRAGKPVYGYHILGFPADVRPSSDEVKQAYRKLLLELHPDKMRDNPLLAGQVSKLLNEAFSVGPQGRIDPSLF